ncbi:MAG: TMEM175 family protein [Saprospiraceae bacterium]|nr:TMEM175 family protein [Saprospiraceae bacterium]
MTKARLETFSDGVVAIIITIMVLEMKVPHSEDWGDLAKLTPVFFSYVLSFAMLGIYWVNHHHLVHAIPTVNAGIMWTNLHLLFWLSLIPFVTAWMGESHFSQNSVILYSVLAFACGFAYYFLLFAIKQTHPHHAQLKKLLKHQTTKGILSNVAYFISFVLAFYQPIISMAIFVLVALLWFIPDKNIEAAFSK